MKKTLPVVTTSIMCLGVANAGYANNDETKAGQMTSLVVIGQQDELSYTQSYLAGALDTVTQEEIAGAHVDNAMELFTKLPGVHMAPWGQGVFESEIGIRGFAADGSTPHAKLLIDGIPSNLNAGYNDMAQLFSSNIKSINVYKGTSDPRYGLYNLAGAYNVETRSDVAQSVEVTVGSFNARETQGYFGFQNGNLKHSYSLGYRKSEGYRDHDNVEKYGASGRWFYDFSDATSLGLIARIARMDTDAPGFLLSEQEVNRDPRQSASYSNQDGGKKNTDAVSIHLDHQWSDNVAWSLKTYYNHFDRQRWLRFKTEWPLQERIYDEKHYGVISTVTWDVANDWQLLWGANYETQDVIEQRWGTINNQRIRNSASPIWNYQYDYNNYGTYVQVNHQATKWLDWNAAVRADRLSGDFTSTDSANVSTHADMYDFGTIIQPKLNVFLYPTDDVVVFANFGRTFQPVFSSSAYTTGDTHARDISVNDGWEIGTKWQATQSLQTRVSYWEQRAKDEFVLVNGVESNVGKTLRQGVDLSADWMWTDSLTLWGNYSITKTEIQTEGANKGNDLRSIPAYTASVGSTYAITENLTWRLHYDMQGDYYINEANVGGKFGGYKLMNSNLEYKTSWGGVNFQVNNLFDEQYEYVFDFTSDASGTTIHAPGDGLNMNLSVNYDF